MAHGGEEARFGSTRRLGPAAGRFHLEKRGGEFRDLCPAVSPPAIEKRGKDSGRDAEEHGSFHQHFHTRPVLPIPGGMPASTSMDNPQKIKLSWRRLEKRYEIG
jgi:hypothetical protein